MNELIPDQNNYQSSLPEKHIFDLAPLPDWVYGLESLQFLRYCPLHPPYYFTRDKDGNPLRPAGVTMDVTISKEQIYREDQDKILREIAWMQSHVVRAPLARIMGLVNLMKSHNCGGKPIEEIQELIMESALELDNVIWEISKRTESIENEK